MPVLGDQTAHPLPPLADLRGLQLGSGCLTDKGKRCWLDRQEPFPTPLPMGPLYTAEN